jgi:hypothetical protein
MAEEIENGDNRFLRWFSLRHLYPQLIKNSKGLHLAFISRWCLRTMPIIPHL